MVRENQLFVRRVKMIMRYGSLFAPIMLAFYCLLIQLGVLPAATPYVSSDLVMVVTLAWLILAVTVFFAQPSDSPLYDGVELGAFYVLASIQTLLITGVTSPLLAYWILLIIASFIYFNRLGSVLGMVWFIVLVGADTLFIHPDDPTSMLLSVTSLVVVLTTSLVIVNIYLTQRTNHRELTDSREREGLERDRVLTLINNLTDAVLSTSANGTVTIYNASALSLLDTNKRLSGTHISDIISLRDTEGDKVDIFNELTKTTAIRQRDDLLLDLDDGEDSLRLEVTLAPIKGNHVGGQDVDVADGYVVILRDITKSKTLEEERDEFISVVSHELRTPITIAEGSLSNAQLLLERGATEEQITAAVKESHDQVLFLARMVNDLSTLSRAERGVADEVEEIKLRDMAQQMYNEYAPQAEEQHLHFNLDLGTHLGAVYTSRLYLEELLQNLITNAIKYTPKGSVTLAITRSQDSVSFRVTDTGIGIGKSDLKKVFDKFYRAEDYRTRETNGTGLGLYVSGKLARKLNTEINVTSRLNHGSTFGFTLTGSQIRNKDVDPADSNEAVDEAA